MTKHFCDACGRRLMRFEPAYVASLALNLFQTDLRPEPPKQICEPDEPRRALVCGPCRDALERLFIDFFVFLKKEIAKEPVDF